MADKTKIHTVYKHSDGSRVPSVTTILGILNKPALLDWAWKCGCDGLDYKAVRDQAADIGTLAHQMIMCHISGKQLDTGEYSAQDIDKAENSFLKYLEWEKGKSLKPLLIEKPLVSETYRYGGTIDFFGIIDGTPTLLDFKTSKAIYAENFYQLAAYRQLLISDGQPVVDADFKILRIGRTEDEGFEERSIKNLDKQWEVFLACKTIYDLQKEIGRDK